MSDEKETLIVASKTKAYIKSQGCNMSGEAIEALNQKLYDLIDQAVARTKENKRQTVRPHDF